MKENQRLKTITKKLIVRYKTKMFAKAKYIIGMVVFYQVLRANEKFTPLRKINC
jgi:hypothetical protein